MRKRLSQMLSRFRFFGQWLDVRTKEKETAEFQHSMKLIKDELIHHPESFFSNLRDIYQDGDVEATTDAVSKLL
jgi:hypothetical protein